MGFILEIFIKITIAVYAAFSAYALCRCVADRIKPPDPDVIGVGYAVILWPASIAGLVLALKCPGENGILALLFLTAVFVAQFRVVMEDLLYFKPDDQVLHPFALPGTVGLLLASACFAVHLAALLAAFVPMAAAVILAVLAVALLLALCFGGFILSILAMGAVCDAIYFLLSKSGEGTD